MKQHQGEFTLWAAQRWHLLRELLMDEETNHAALGGKSVGKFQARTSRGFRDGKSSLRAIKVWGTLKVVVTSV